MRLTMVTHPRPDPQPDPRTEAAKVLSAHLVRAAEATARRAWRDQTPRTAHGQYDLALTDHYTPQIRAAMRERYTDGDIRAVIITAQQALPPLTGGIRKAAKTETAETQQRRTLAAFIAAILAGRGTTEALRRVLRDLWRDAWQTGRHVAEQQIGALPKPRRPHPAETAQTQTGGTGGRPPRKPPTAVGGDEPRDLPEFVTPTQPLPDDRDGGDGVSIDLDWSRWRPGWPEAAQQTADGELRRQLDRLGHTLDGIDRATVDRVGDAIARGLLDGDPIERIARDVDSILGDPQRALKIAHTESARAQCQASLTTYREEGFTAFDWIASQGACPACAEKEASNPHPIDATPPPLHPFCRCALAAAVDHIDTDE